MSKWLKNRKLIVLATFLMSAGTVIGINAAPAFAAGPYSIHETNGNYAVDANQLTTGSTVREKPTPGRSMTVVNAGGTYNNDVQKFIEFSNGTFMATTNDCTGVVIKASSSNNGTIWTEHVTGGNLILVNKNCDLNGDSTQALAGNNVNGHAFGICGPPLDCSGLFRAMTLTPV